MSNEIKIILKNTEGYNFKKFCNTNCSSFAVDVLLLDTGYICYIMWVERNNIILQINYISENNLTKKNHYLGKNGTLKTGWEGLSKKHHKITKMLLTRYEETFLLMKKLRGEVT